MKFDQDLCLNLQTDFGKMNSTLGSVVPLAMFALLVTSTTSCFLVALDDNFALIVEKLHQHSFIG